MPIIFYSLLTIIATALVGLGLFFRLRKNHLLESRPFFWHWAVGFAIFSLIHIPVLAVNLQAQFSYQQLISTFLVSFFATLAAYLFFYRGITLLLTKSRFWLNKFPLIVFLIIGGVVSSSFFIFKLTVPTIMTIFSFGFTFPVAAYLGLTFFYIYIKGCFRDAAKRRLSVFLLSLTWFYILVLDVIIWQALVVFPADFWIIKLASLKGWFIARAIAHILILIGFLLYSECLQSRKTAKKE